LILDETMWSSRRRVQNAPASLKNFIGQSKKTFSTLSAISRLPFSKNRRIADDKNVNGSLSWLAVCRAKVVTRKQVLYRRTPTRLTPPFKLPPAL